MRRHHFIATILSGLLFLAPATAQSPSIPGLDIAKEVVTSMKVDATMRAILPNLSRQIVDIMASQNPAVRNDAEAFMERFQPEFLSRLSEINDEAAEVYAKRFTPAELTDLLTFIKTPTGQKLFNEQGNISIEMIDVGQRWGQSVARDVIEKMKVELRSKGHRI
jgi:uncharacterized protein